MRRAGGTPGWGGPAGHTHTPLPPHTPPTDSCPAPSQAPGSPPVPTPAAELPRQQRLLPHLDGSHQEGTRGPSGHQDGQRPGFDGPPQPAEGLLPTFLVFEALLRVCSGLRDVMRLSFCAAKALNSDILSKREALDGVLKANVACCSSIQVRMLPAPPPNSLIKTMNCVFQDYETDLAAYTSGLETLLNIPIKRTMLKSPTVDLHQEVAGLSRSLFACRSSHFSPSAVSGCSAADALRGAPHHVCRPPPIPGRPAQTHGGAEGSCVAALFNHHQLPLT